MIFSKRYFPCIVLLFLTACSNSDRRVSPEDGRQVPLGKSIKSEAFNLSFGKLLDDYYALKEGFIAEDQDTIINHLAGAMASSADSLRLSGIKADSSIIMDAGVYAGSISAELKGLAGETTPEAKRRSFQMVSDELYDLIRIVGYNRAVIYRLYCPMAFEDHGAAWLSNSPVIRNPYLPKKMPECGEVKDTLGMVNR
jgi:Cu(I)/Ag(I) efflux system membrane fusion protein